MIAGNCCPAQGPRQKVAGFRQRRLAAQTLAHVLTGVAGHSRKSASSASDVAEHGSPPASAVERDPPLASAVDRDVRCRSLFLLCALTSRVLLELSSPHPTACLRHSWLRECSTAVDTPLGVPGLRAIEETLSAQWRSGESRRTCTV